STRSKRSPLRVLSFAAFDNEIFDLQLRVELLRQLIYVFCVLRAGHRSAALTARIWGRGLNRSEVNRGRCRAYALASSQRCVRVIFLGGSLMHKRLANSRACSLQCAAQTGLVVTAENRYMAGFSQHRAGKKLRCRQASSRLRSISSLQARSLILHLS